MEKHNLSPVFQTRSDHRLKVSQINRKLDSLEEALCITTSNIFINILIKETAANCKGNDFLIIKVIILWAKKITRSSGISCIINMWVPKLVM